MLKLAVEESKEISDALCTPVHREVLICLDEALLYDKEILGVWGEGGLQPFKIISLISD